MKTGKSAKTTLIYVAVLSLLLGTAVFIQFQASATLVTANVKFEPRKIDLGAPSPKELQVTLWFSGKYKDYNVSDIDGRTILVEGVLEPKGGWKHMKIVDNTLIFEVDGPGLVDLVIWPKIYHMGIVDPNPNRPFKIPITVTGQFNYGTPFEGTYEIRVMIPSNPGPPPPPPI